MGCCIPKSDYLINKNSELNTNREDIMKNQLKSNKINMNSNQNIDSNKQRELEETEIPNRIELQVPLMKIPSTIIQTKKQLQLTIIESKHLQEGKILSINPGGIIGSERDALDGITYFGVNNTQFKNDFNFPEEESNIAIRHFEIKYDIQNDEYKIKNLSGSGLYIKIENKMILKNNSVFSFSSTLICVKINLNINNFGSTISLKIIHGTNQNNEYSFNSNDKVLIRLGRLKTNLIDIDFNDESTSRLQTSILYENNNWYIVDGDGVKKSLNGTWFFADEYITINEGMIFRAGSTTFKSHLFTP